MTKILAIAVLAIRSAVRSRVVIVLLGLLLLAVIGLPLTVKGDGTLGGQILILIGYTLGAVGGILSLATIWAGCAALSLEVEERQIHLVVTKPVHRIQIWLGKWLGLLAVNAVLLALSGAVVYGMLRWTARPGALTPADRETLREEILVSRSVVNATPVDVSEPARRQLEEQIANGQVPPHVPVEQVYRAIESSLLTQAFSIPPGSSHRWVFPLPARMNSERPLLLRFKFSSSELVATPVRGAWNAGPPEAPTRFQMEDETMPGRTHSFLLPAQVAAGARELVIEYRNASATSATVIFHPADGLRLLPYQGTFEANLVRALVMIFFNLAFLGAIGLAAGTVLSMPVAAFVSAAALILLKAGHYVRTVAQSSIVFVEHAHGAPAQEPTFWDRLFRLLFQILDHLLRPLQGADPLELLATGTHISGDEVGTALLVKVILYAGALGLLASWMFSRREIALPA